MTRNSAYVCLAMESLISIVGCNFQSAENQGFIALKSVCAAGQISRYMKTLFKKVSRRIYVRQRKIAPWAPIKFQSSVRFPFIKITISNQPHFIARFIYNQSFKLKQIVETNKQSKGTNERVL